MITKKIKYLIYHKGQNPILLNFLLEDSISGLGVSYKFLQIFPSLKYIKSFRPQKWEIHHFYLATFNLRVRPSIIKIPACFCSNGCIFFWSQYNYNCICINFLREELLQKGEEFRRGTFPPKKQIVKTYQDFHKLRCCLNN